MNGRVLDGTPEVPHHPLHESEQGKQGQNQPSSPVHSAVYWLAVCCHTTWRQKRLPFGFAAPTGTHGGDLKVRSVKIASLTAVQERRIDVFPGLVSISKQKQSTASVSVAGRYCACPSGNTRS